MDHSLRKVDDQVPIIFKRIRNKLSVKRIAVLVLTLLIIATAAFFMLGNKKTFKVSLDLNPSFVLDLSQDQKVNGVSYANSDAQKVLEGMNIKGADMNMALSAIIGSMLKHGYLKDQYAFLIGVEGENQQKADYIKYNLLQETSKILSGSNLNGTIYNQVYAHQNDEVSNIAQQYQISYSKANFIFDMMKLDSTLNVAELSKMTMSELNDIINGKSLDLKKGDSSLSVQVNGKVESSTQGVTAENNSSQNAQQPSSDASQNNATTGNGQSNTTPNTGSSSNQGTTTPPVVTPPVVTPPVVTPPVTPPASNSVSVTEINNTIAGYQARYNQLAAVVNFQNVFSYIPQIKALDREVGAYEDRLEYLGKSGQLDWGTYIGLKAKIDLLENQVDRLEDFYDD